MALQLLHNPFESDSRHKALLDDSAISTDRLSGVPSEQVIVGLASDASGGSDGFFGRDQSER